MSQTMADFGTAPGAVFALTVSRRVYVDGLAHNRDKRILLCRTDEHTGFRITNSPIAPRQPPPGRPWSPQ